MISMSEHVHGHGSEVDRVGLLPPAGYRGTTLRNFPQITNITPVSALFPLNNLLFYHHELNRIHHFVFRALVLGLLFFNQM